NYKNKRAHRFFYEMIIGKISEEKVIDHTCRNKSCVNPAHMEVVTVGENSRRGKSKTMEAHRNNTCANGHKWNRENMRIRPQKDGTAKICCRICQNETQKARRRRGIA
ncbi:HNH endonuclease, partial [bacterium]|nr:HNH endonuclease [bacterium]